MPRANNAAGASLLSFITVFFSIFQLNIFVITHVAVCCVVCYCCLFYESKIFVLLDFN